MGPVPWALDFELGSVGRRPSMCGPEQGLPGGTRGWLCSVVSHTFSFFCAPCAHSVRHGLGAGEPGAATHWPLRALKAVVQFASRA